MSVFVLVHGACHQAAHWTLIVDRLQNAGREAVAMQLPGHPISDGSATLGDAIAATCSAIEAIDDQVVLVGHSLGGMVVAGAAEKMPRRIARIDFLAALLPADGESGAMIGTGEGFGAHRVSVVDQLGRVSIPSAPATDMFFEGQVPIGTPELCPTDSGYLNVPVALSNAGFGSLRKRYIICLRDKAIAPFVQHRLSGKWPGIERIELDTGHCPMITAPDLLAATLLE